MQARVAADLKKTKTTTRFVLRNAAIPTLKSYEMTQLKNSKTKKEFLTVDKCPSLGGGGGGKGGFNHLLNLRGFLFLTCSLW